MSLREWFRRWWSGERAPDGQVQMHSDLVDMSDLEDVEQLQDWLERGGP